MYDPAHPNHYRDVVFSAYVRRRQREEAAESERQRLPNALAAALFGATTSPDAAALTAVSTAPSLGLSAEALHQQRVKESAALGVQRAVEMEKDALEVAHQQRRLEGSDARSRIGSKLDKLKALAAKTRAVTAASTAPPNAGSGEVASRPVDPSSSRPPPSSPSPPPSAPLVFQRSSLAAGGYVMTTATAPPASGSGLPASLAARPAVQGKPSSTLLLRFLHCSPLLGWSQEAITHAAATTSAAAADPSLAGDTPPWAASVLAPVQQRCRRFGFVRHMAARVYTADAVRDALAQRQQQQQQQQSAGMSTGPAPYGDLPTAASASPSPFRDEVSAAAVLREQLRVWVRYDSVTEAFKAAEKLAQELVSVSPSSPTPDGTVAGPLFTVCFYPTSLFDGGTLELRDEDLLPLLPQHTA